MKWEIILILISLRHSKLHLIFSLIIWFIYTPKNKPFDSYLILIWLKVSDTTEAFFYTYLCTAFRNKHPALGRLNPSEWRCYDLYFFIVGVYRLVSGSRHGRFYAFLGELHEAPAFLLDLLPACYCACDYRSIVFHLRLCLRCPKPWLLCPHLRSSGFRTKNPWRSFATTCLSITWVRARRRDSPSIAPWLTTTASAYATRQARKP